MSFGTLSIEFAPAAALAPAGGGRNPGGDPAGDRLLAPGARQPLAPHRLRRSARGLGQSLGRARGPQISERCRGGRGRRFREPERAAAPRADGRRFGRGREADQGDPRAGASRHPCRQRAVERVGGRRRHAALHRAGQGDLRSAGEPHRRRRLHQRRPDPRRADGSGFPRLPRPGAYAAERPARRGRPAPGHGRLPQLRHRRQDRRLQAPGRGWRGLARHAGPHRHHEGRQALAAGAGRHRRGRALQFRHRPWRPEHLRIHRRAAGPRS